MTPSWYATKQESGKVVPTWNYLVVQARGALRVHEEHAWLRAQIGALTRQQEAAEAAPWAVEDAPPDFIDKLLGGIVGLEIACSSLIGKWKLSQNRPEPDRVGVQRGLEGRGSDAASELARRMQPRQRSALRSSRRAMPKQRGSTQSDESSASSGSSLRVFFLGALGALARRAGGLALSVKRM